MPLAPLLSLPAVVPASLSAVSPAALPVLGEIMPHSHVGAYAAVPSTEVVAVCDLAPARLEEFRRSWSARFPQARCYTDYREMLARERVDLLSVVTSDDRHAQIVVDAVEAGVRGILCEKPIATTLADADRIGDTMKSFEKLRTPPPAK